MLESTHNLRSALGNTPPLPKGERRNKVLNCTLKLTAPSKLGKKLRNFNVAVFHCRSDAGPWHASDSRAVQAGAVAAGPQGLRQRQLWDVPAVVERVI